jgi:OmpA-OmpF porin, OOP family
MLRKSLFALTLLAGAACAHADENRGFTFGVGASRNDYELDEAFVGAPLKDDSFGYSFFAGYRFLPYLAVEGHYFEGGSAEWSFTDLGLKIDTKAYGASVMGTLPLGHGFGLFARAGFLHAEMEADIIEEGEAFWAKDSSDEPFYGVGARAMLDGAQVRLEYLQSEFELLDTRIIQLSVAWLF